jgi:hypothetical protein
MTESPEPFAQHPRLAELVNSLHFRRYPLFLAGLLYEEPGGPLRRAIAVASRDGDLLAYAGGQVVEHPGWVPASRLLDDEDLAERSDKTRVDALADLNQAFFAHEVAGWTRGRRSVNEVGMALLHHGFVPQGPRLAITHSEVLGVVPLEVTDALLHEFRRLADRHERGFMVEQAMELLARS